MTEKTQRPRYSPEVRERAVRMVAEHGREHASQWAAIVSIAGKIGCSAQTLHNWVAQAERDSGVGAGPTSAELQRIKALERENRELRQANEILRKASAYFAQRVGCIERSEMHVFLNIKKTCISLRSMHPTMLQCSRIHADIIASAACT